VPGSIEFAREAVKLSKKPMAAASLRAQIEELIRTKPSARLDYVEFFDSVTLQPTQEVRRGTHMALAVFVGKTRLIDNGRL
jgi:pantoate--beta-alanine ligase